MTGLRSLLFAALLFVPGGATRAAAPAIDRLVEQAIRRGDIPGAVVLVGQGDRILHRAAYGHRRLRPQKLPMQVDTLFDLASLTKPLATATSIFLLAEHGRLELSDPVARHLPAFAAAGKAEITIKQLLRHEGGLAPANHLREYADGAAAALKAIDAAAPRWPPGSRFAYSDLGYIVLGRVVERAGGEPLQAFTRRLVFAPMGMTRTSFLPPATWQKNCAATGQRGGGDIVGQVHDPRAFALGGVAGHAGLFGTADDVGRFCRVVLSGGVAGDRRVLRPETVAAMLRPRPLPTGAGIRSGAFDVDTVYSSARGLRFARGHGGGHSGFTGTFFWIDPSTGTYVVFLSNRLHPGGGHNITDLYRAIATAAAETALGPAPGVLAGIDVLRRTNYAQLEGRRVGLITNHTGRSRDGTRTIDLLHKSRHVQLVKIFSPEHGLLGKLDQKVGHGTDSATGLKVYSLYGESRRPKAEWLADIDTLVFDIQDVGTRFYTYITTMGYAMEEAARHGRRFV
ncbi:MAG: serine hydrolase, partial [Phycisphaerae bacterium]|nr:serine hydrolase [Phycisphaerae bacterium]